MTNFAELKEVLTHYRPFNDTVDIGLTYYIFYRLLLIIKGTRAFQMLIGIGLIVLALIASRALEFYTLDWLIHSFWSQIVLAVVVVFQPEIRRTLAQVGERRFFKSLSPVEESKFIEETVKASVSMANKRIGALIVLERETDLSTIVEMGTELDAKVSKELLVSIFLPYSPIHDGAGIIRNGRIIAAGCFLPLTLSSNLSKALGTRHRAAVGLTEESDAVVVVVSEETGEISVVMDGVIERDVNAPTLRKMISDVFVKKKKK
ncbi:MAG: TIGR00159 family protein [Nitrospirae bacterium RBG_19FT_COMBO_55_12]|nr:MAG: TIGR00159 family protein [Nitrospirae bacterium RBG_19FT_COMBO_55_12]